MPKSYTHLNLDERITIQMHLPDGDSIRTMAQALKRSPSNICRELRRCGWKGKPKPSVRAARRSYSDAGQ
jgi:IS30 family transposase